MMKYYAQV